MAKVEGAQSIPAEWLDEYRATLTEKQPDNIVRRRYPYRLPKMQSNKGRPHAKQLIQRQRFKTALSKFGSIGSAERARWYDSMPVWGSFLWYYNYFILSALMGNANLDQGGAGVIKGINHYTFTLPTGTPVDVTVSISAIDPVKAVAMLFGAGFNYYQDTVGVANYPYLVSLNSSQAFLKGSLPNKEAAGCGVSIIEYI